MNDLTRTLEALLFLSAQPVAAADLARATEATEGQVAEAIELLREDLAEGGAGSSCARSPAASPSPAIPPARKRRGACSRTRARRR